MRASASETPAIEQRPPTICCGDHFAACLLLRAPDRQQTTPNSRPPAACVDRWSDKRKSGGVWSRGECALRERSQRVASISFFHHRSVDPATGMLINILQRNQETSPAGVRRNGSTTSSSTNDNFVYLPCAVPPTAEMLRGNSTHRCRALVTRDNVCTAMTPRCFNHLTGSQPGRSAALLFILMAPAANYRFEDFPGCSQNPCRLG